MSAAAVVAALRAPIDQLLLAVDSAGPAGVVSALNQAHTAVAHVGDATRHAWSQVADAWSGLAADTAWGHVTGVGELAQRLAERSR